MERLYHEHKFQRFIGLAHGNNLLHPAICTENCKHQINNEFFRMFLETLQALGATMLTVDVATHFGS